MVHREFYPFFVGRALITEGLRMLLTTRLLLTLLLVALTSCSNPKAPPTQREVRRTALEHFAAANSATVLPWGEGIGRHEERLTIEKQHALTETPVAFSGFLLDAWQVNDGSVMFEFERGDERFRLRVDSAMGSRLIAGRSFMRGYLVIAHLQSIAPAEFLKTDVDNSYDPETGDGDAYPELREDRTIIIRGDLIVARPFP
ncbi:MAG: hypothetical protein JWM27_889 [Gemmatimonadetes bacterium]|nr:hypothetical protein [Gemmatimonadota bacterium]